MDNFFPVSRKEKAIAQFMKREKIVCFVNQTAMIATQLFNWITASFKY